MTIQPPSRRNFLHAISATAGGTALAASFDQLLSRAAHGKDRPISKGLGPLSPVADESTGLELIQLPEGFRYKTFGWTGDALTGGGTTPSDHDGMAVIAQKGSRLTICRNHEIGGSGAPFTDQVPAYDSNAAGGCVLLEFDLETEQFTSSRPALAGTVKNCAGGPTPWGTWLSCEETVLGRGDSDDGKPLELQRDHGFIFEVDPVNGSNGKPIKDMGRFVHEAICIDPKTNIVYETEDRKTAGLYRYLPNQPGDLAAGGKLQMLKVVGMDDVRRDMPLNKKFDCQWVDIEDTQRAHSPGTQDELGVHMQGKAAGGSTFGRLEGCWFSHETVHLVSTNGGNADIGQVFFYEPASETIRLVFESPNPAVLDSPDNMTVHPSGCLLLCEDGDADFMRLHGLSREGELFQFAANNTVLNGERNGFQGDFRKEEWAGSSFSPDGEWLFVNLQQPGLTLAITGPWQDGPFRTA
jgi:hypothetical protein